MCKVIWSNRNRVTYYRLLVTFYVMSDRIVNHLHTSIVMRPDMVSMCVRVPILLVHTDRARSTYNDARYRMTTSFLPMGATRCKHMRNTLHSMLPSKWCKCVRSLTLSAACVSVFDVSQARAQSSGLTRAFVSIGPPTTRAD